MVKGGLIHTCWPATSLVKKDLAGDEKVRQSALSPLSLQAASQVKGRPTSLSIKENCSGNIMRSELDGG
jgi:hypothetical protein